MDSDTPAFVLGTFLGLILFFPIGGCTGRDRGKESVQREACKRGLAKYVTNPEGDPVFTWVTDIKKEEAKPEKPVEPKKVEE
jgi:hypothetical protein